MYNQLKNFLRKYPWLFNSFKIAYYQVLKNRFFATLFQEWVWQTKHLLGAKNWYKECIDSVKHPHRKRLIEVIEQFQPFEKLLELGCNIGQNLYLLAQKYPLKKFTGIDINFCAVKQGKVFLQKNNISNVEFSLGKFKNLTQYKDKSIDILLTDAAFIYLGPEQIKKVLSEMIRIARKAIILYEWQIWDEQVLQAGKYSLYCSGHWVYNYNALFLSFPTVKKVEIEKVAAGIWHDYCWDKYGAIIKVTL